MSALRLAWGLLERAEVILTAVGGASIVAGVRRHGLRCWWEITNPRPQDQGND